MEGNFEMLITRSKPKLRLESDLSKKMQFSTDFSQNFTEHPSTIALLWQQWMSHGTGLYLEFKPISIYTNKKVRKVQLPAAYRCSTADGRTKVKSNVPPY